MILYKVENADNKLTVHKESKIVFCVTINDFITLNRDISPYLYKSF